jgi:hypothetical protein
MADSNDRTRHPMDDPPERVPVDPRQTASIPAPPMNASEAAAHRGLGWSDALDADDIGDIADEGRGHRG